MNIETITKLSATVVLAITFTGTANAGKDVTGNGGPSGGHYNLDIRGTDHCPGNDMKGSNGHVIHVLLNFDDGSQHGADPNTLDKTNKIFLEEGEDFRVNDGNACDGDGAVFQLPANPFDCPEADPDCLDVDPDFQAYSVWARALGKPGGNATVTTCATDPSTGLIVCSSEQEVFVRNKGKSSFRNVTTSLTTIRADLDGDGNDERVGLFEDELQDYFWDYDNNGLRLLQMRFYPVAD